MEVKIRNWRYDDGWKKLPESFRQNSIITNDIYFDERSRGWQCHVYTSNLNELKIWIKDNLKGPTDFFYVSNSNNPYYIFHIKDEEDATFFKLTWL